MCISGETQRQSDASGCSSCLNGSNVARHAESDTRGLADVRGLTASFVPAYARPSYPSSAVRVTADHPRSRDRLMHDLLDRGGSTRRGIMNVHQEPAYGDLGPYQLPHSEAARDAVMLLPLYLAMADEVRARVLAAPGG